MVLMKMKWLHSLIIQKSSIYRVGVVAEISKQISLLGPINLWPLGWASSTLPTEPSGPTGVELSRNARGSVKSLPDCASRTRIHSSANDPDDLVGAFLSKETSVGRDFDALMKSSLPHELYNVYIQSYIHNRYKCMYNIGYTIWM